METPHPGHVPLDLGDLEWGLNFTINFAETGATCDVDTLCWIFARKVRVQLSLQLLTCTVGMGKHIGEEGVLERGWTTHGRRDDCFQFLLLLFDMK